MNNLQSKIESLLFLESKPLTLKKIAATCAAPVNEVEEALRQLQAEYDERGGGVVVVLEGGNVQLATSKKNAEFINGYIAAEEAGELTRPSLETLTIIAYRGPVSKSEIELIRGVNCSLILRNLLIRGMVEEVGETESGSPLYRVTLDFLRFLGLNKAADLPDYDELNKNTNLQELLESRADKDDFFSDPSVGTERGEMMEESADDEEAVDDNREERTDY
ncbi:MAG: SMC-Scp complex subunit ScpB [Candidatus Kerfeldbacteria bacterium]